MDAPPVQYTQTSDGANISLASIGAGPAVVLPPAWITHVQRTWDVFGAAYQQLADRGRRVVWYDKRGTGLSDREHSDFSLEALVTDLEAVVDHIEPENPVSLIGLSLGGPTAIAYTARHPQLVARLALWGPGAGQPEIDAATEAIVALIRADWDTGSGALAYRFAGDEPTVPDGATDFSASMSAYARLMRNAATSDVAADVWEALHSVDVYDLLSSLTVPTLVGHNQFDRVVAFSRGQELAATIDGALFVAQEESSHAPAPTGWEAIFDFLVSGDDVDATLDLERALQTILFTDLAGSTAMQSRLGDEGAMEVLRAHDAAVRQAIGEFNGREVKHTGDGMMTAFGSAADAVNCALTVRRDIATYNDTHEGEELLVRFGLNAGEPIAKDDDLFGLSVTLAARIGDWGEPGQVLCSNVVRELLLGKGFQFTSVGEAVLKGFEEPMALYEVSA